MKSKLSLLILIIVAPLPAMHNERHYETQRNVEFAKSVARGLVFLGAGSKYLIVAERNRTKFRLQENGSQAFSEIYYDVGQKVACCCGTLHFCCACGIFGYGLYKKHCRRNFREE
jgi:hypothetical protein